MRGSLTHPRCRPSCPGERPRYYTPPPPSSQVLLCLCNYCAFATAILSCLSCLLAGGLIAFHLDELRGESKHALATLLGTLRYGTRRKVLLFCSPESLQTDVWQTALESLITNRVLSLVAIDETDKVPPSSPPHPTPVHPRSSAATRLSTRSTAAL